MGINLEFFFCLYCREYYGRKGLTKNKIMTSKNSINFKGKNILIVGGTGSFGNRFLENIINYKIKFNRINILSRDEKKQYDMREIYNNSKIKFHIGNDIRDVECTNNVTKRSMRLYFSRQSACEQVPSYVNFIQSKQQKRML